MKTARTFSHSPKLPLDRFLVRYYFRELGTRKSTQYKNPSLWLAEISMTGWHVGDIPNRVQLSSNRETSKAPRTQNISCLESKKTLLSPELKCEDLSATNGVDRFGWIHRFTHKQRWFSGHTRGWMWKLFSACAEEMSTVYEYGEVDAAKTGKSFDA